jgi:zinc protease
VNARVRRIADVVTVRDAILQTAARLRSEPVSARVLADAKAAERYELLRSLDTTEHVAATLAGYVRFERSYTTLGRYFKLLDTLTPDDLRNAAQRYFVDDGLVVTTLSNGEMPAAMATPPKLASLDTRRDDSRIALTLQPSLLPQVRLKLLFSAGAAHDPPGKEGLAALTAAMVAEAGSNERSFDDVKQALFPLAGVFSAQVDKEMSTFTGNVHPERWREFVDIVMPMLLQPGFRDTDFQRLKARQASALKVELKGNDDEELAKERLQTNVYAGTPYGHPVLGTEKSIEGLTLDDVRNFHRRAYTQGALRVGLAGPADAAMAAALKQVLARLPAEPALPATAVPAGRTAQGLEVEIVEKETRATAISLGLPLAVTRSHPDFVALSVARSWLGEHRNWSSHLFKRIREERGLNYGDYAYIEAFPHSGWQDVPTPNVARRSQLFEVWIRPVTTTENAHFALRIALAEIDRLVEQGLTAAQFEATREFLSKYVFLMTASQDAQLGYALDAQWYGTPEFTTMMRDGLAKLTLADVNAAVRRHLSAHNLSVVIVTKDAADMKARLLDDRVSAIRYDGNKPAALLAEDQIIGARKLAIRPQALTVTPLSRVFAE